jgi:uncharacterized protein
LNLLTKKKPWTKFLQTRLCSPVRNFNQYSCCMLSCTLEIRLHPGSKQECVVRGDNDSITARVKDPPIEGRANSALIKLLAKMCGIPKSNISIKRGQTSKNKVVEISGLSKEQVLHKIPLT